MHFTRVSNCSACCWPALMLQLLLCSTACSQPTQHSHPFSFCLLPRRAASPLCATTIPPTIFPTPALGPPPFNPVRDGTTTRAEGATYCEVAVSGGSSSSSRLDAALGGADVAILLSFGLLLDGTSLESVSRWGGQEIDGPAAVCSDL